MEASVFNCWLLHSIWSVCLCDLFLMSTTKIDTNCAWQRKHLLGNICDSNANRDDSNCVLLFSLAEMTCVDLQGISVSVSDVQSRRVCHAAAIVPQPYYTARIDVDVLRFRMVTIDLAGWDNTMSLFYIFIRLCTFVLDIVYVSVNYDLFWHFGSVGYVLEEHLMYMLPKCWFLLSTFFFYLF